MEALAGPNVTYEVVCGALMARRAGDSWSFEDVFDEGALTSGSIEVSIPLGALYRDNAGVIVP